MKQETDAGERASEAPAPVDEHHIQADIEDLHSFGYRQKLRRTIGLYTSFALGFSMITITTTIFTLFAQPFQTIGGVAIWLWIPTTLGILAIAAVYAHLSARLPVTGYAYQWSSRLVNRQYGWFAGWTAMLAFFTGTASIAVAMATVFAPYIWTNPSHADISLFAALAIVAAVIVNVISIRAATWFNNVGASTELIGTVGLTIVTAIGLFFFAHKQGGHVLVQTGSSSGGAINITTIGLALLLPVYTLLGWEGSADLAEESRDPRRIAPKAMFRSVIISGIAAFFVYAVFAMAIPGTIANTANQTTNPLIYVFQAHFGAGLADLLKVIAFISIFSALLANVTVATRMCFSLSRDNMLPGSSVLARVNSRTRTPIYSILLVGVVSLIINLLSAGIIARVVAIVAVTYYGTYVFTMVAVLIAKRRGTIPDAPPRYFNLKGWLVPLAWISIVWSAIIMLYMTVPAVNNIAGEYTLYFEAAGVLWFVLYLRRKLMAGEAGPPVEAHSEATDAEEEKIAEESISVRHVA
jgi:amino acid transporter